MMFTIFKTFKSIIFNELIKSNNINIKLSENLKINKIKITALYK